MASTDHPRLPSCLVAAMAAADTPAVLVDDPRLSANVARMAALAATAGVRLRPHAKTHKSLALARRQMDAGATGLTVAKTAEAELFLAGGIRSVTIAHPLVSPEKIDRALRAASKNGAEVRFIADSESGIDALAGSARAAGRTVPVYLKVDVGLHRCGVDPDSEAALLLARRIAANGALRFAGLLSHAGHAYRLPDGSGLRDIAARERAAMMDLTARLRAAGVDVAEVSVGCTPTVIRNDGFDGITEIRPGNYVYMDRIQVGLGVATLAEVALWVVATVVSVNDRFAIVDAGSKVLSSDRGPHGATSVDGYGLAWRIDRDTPPMTVASVSEEHGFVEHRGAAPSIGTRVAILPNHACSVVNLARHILVAKPDGTIEAGSVDGRALVT
jgi:D-serine deaminase-like pyridoxal phosphate-dependent protein